MEERHMISSELLQQIKFQLSIQPNGVFYPVNGGRSNTVRCRLLDRRRSLTKKWKKLRNSPRQFVRDSIVIKWALTVRQPRL